MATETDKTKTGALGTLLAVGLFATVSIMLSVTALVRYSTRGVSDQRQDLAMQPYRDLHQQESGKLSGAPTWTDKGQGKVSIPIERAKTKVLAELARDPSSATPPGPPQPTAAADAADAGVAASAAAPGAAEGEKAPTPAPSAPTSAAPAPTHAALDKKLSAPAPGSVAVAKPATPTPAPAKPAAPTTAAAAAPATPPAPAPAPAAPAAPKPTDG